MRDLSTKTGRIQTHLMKGVRVKPLSASDVTWFCDGSVVIAYTNADGNPMVARYTADEVLAAGEGPVTESDFL